MVLARVFRGVDAERMALALVKELRHEYKLPAYILRTKDYPGKSLMRGTPPTVPSNVMAPDIKMPEKIRTFDEAAVLIGNEKTLAGSEKLWHQVRKIKPKCLDEMSTPFLWREGLSRSYRTTNPYVPAQTLYPQHQGQADGADELGAAEHRQLPGSLQPSDCRVLGAFDVSVEPAAAAEQHVPQPEGKPAADGRRRRGKDGRQAGQGRRVSAAGTADLRVARPDLQPGFRRFVRLPEDPRAGEVRERLMQMAVPARRQIQQPRARGKNALDTMIVPALALTDLTETKAKIRN